ncbi:hypothetical protein [Rhodoferax sp.]|uniref:hypothetical protein n=1 Tax=Rhodoferax sp. TaxID=50421 RepID=UPI0025E960B9|nr:hypothetical protein [Rhodoferax sp.]
MGLTKTDKARAELQPGQRSLGQRERALLLLADGRKTAHEMGAYLGHEGEQLVLQLLRDGYLTQPRVAAVPVAADPFDGKRSMATTRMFLFDICERMFARRAPALAEALREALRNARDRSSMLDVSHTILAEVESAAGLERANTLRERIALLLPEAVAA